MLLPVASCQRENIIGSRQNASAPSFLLWVALAVSQAVRVMSA